MSTRLCELEVDTNGRGRSKTGRDPWLRLVEALAEAIADDLLASLATTPSGRAADGPLPADGPGSHTYHPERRADGRARQ